MKRTLLSLFFSIFCIALITAQITINNAYFPAAGDTLRIATDNLPSNIDLGSTGGPQTWDFSNLQAPSDIDILFENAADGMFSANFPGAELFTANLTGSEAYYNITPDQFQLLGTFGEIPFDIGLEAIARFSPPLTERWAPLSFGASESSFAKVNFPFSPDDLPINPFDSLPISPDSLRLSLETDRTDFVDAFGTMNIPGGSFEVLRIKRQDEIKTLLEAKFIIGGWFNVSDLIPENPLLGERSQTTYLYFAEGIKEPIAVVYTDTADSDIVTRVEFKSMDPIINSTIAPTSQPGVLVYPNPAIEDVRFDFQNLPAGDYDLHIYNILGVSVWQKSYYINGSKTVKASLANLYKGTYLYSIINSEGRTISTKRLMIVRP